MKATGMQNFPLWLIIFGKWNFQDYSGNLLHFLFYFFFILTDQTPILKTYFYNLVQTLHSLYACKEGSVCLFLVKSYTCKSRDLQLIFRLFKIFSETRYDSYLFLHRLQTSKKVALCVFLAKLYACKSRNIAKKWSKIGQRYVIFFDLFQFSQRLFV